MDFFFGDLSRFHHRVQHQVAALDHPLRVAIRIEKAGMLDHSRQHGALGEIQLLHVFAEIGLRRLAKAVDGKASLLPQGDLIGIDLEDLLLVKAVLQLKGDGDLDDLALQLLLGRKEKAARELHGKRGTALPPPAQP